jgi:hypothetical protein
MSGESHPRDEHDRIMWPDSVVPEVGAGFGVWQGNVVTPDLPYDGNSVSGCHPTDGSRPYATCTSGWVRSGAWWLHCSVCHPYTRAENEERTAPRLAALVYDRDLCQTCGGAGELWTEADGRDGWPYPCPDCRSHPGLAAPSRGGHGEGERP